MKKYFLTVNHGKVKKSSGSYNGLVHIYKLKAGDLKYLTSVEFSSGMTPGPEAEAMKALLTLKEITQKDFEFSKCSWRGAGYYDDSNGKFTIKVLL